MSKTNETRHIKWHKTCKCKCRLDASVCNNKQRWNKDKSRCEYKELIDKGMCDKGFIWNPSNCEWECDKSCDIGEYLDYKECSENIDENKMFYNETLNIISSSDNNKTSDSCIVYIVLFSVFLLINISMAIYVYFFIYSFKKQTSNSHYFD